MPTLTSQPLKIKGQALKTFKFSAHTWKVNQRLESQTPPYLPNGDRLGKFYYTIGFRTLINGGVGHLKTQKKNPILVGTPM
jgi:hypothetical protein